MIAGLVPSGVDEFFELITCHRTSADREPLPERDFVTRAFLAAPFRLGVRRAHGELARRHHHHDRAAAAFPEAVLRLEHALFLDHERQGGIITGLSVGGAAVVELAETAVDRSEE